MSLAQRKPMRVLIVDDEPDIEVLIRQRFRRRDGEFDFVFARNGEEALECVAADPSLELVVTDINMPVMDGLALLQKLGSFENRIFKAVILSAYGDLQNIRAAMNGGAFDFLTKPIDFADFETTLRRTGEAVEAVKRALEARRELNDLERELEIAARIQAASLPRDFLPGHKEFGIYARMAPARRVGGDFYDFFPVDGRRLGFVIGDVSGKGIPAALFMAVSRTLIRTRAQQGVTPAECLCYANEALRRQGEGAVYVTAFYGILHSDTGLVEFALGGHNPPLHLTAGGEMKPIDEPGGTVIGLLPSPHFETGRLQLAAGESIFLYTDGISEAMDPDGRFFGERRLREALAAGPRSSPRRLVENAFSAVADFTVGALQSDDITAMAVTWQP